jgi:hypothetical protein
MILNFAKSRNLPFPIAATRPCVGSAASTARSTLACRTRTAAWRSSESLPAEEHKRGREGGREGGTHLGKGRVLLEVTVGDGTTGIADGVLEVPGEDLGLGHLRGGREGGQVRMKAS